MRVLLTGAFGNIGLHTLRELLAQGHTVRCFDVAAKENKRRARQVPGGFEVVWGDLRRPADVARAVQGQEAIVHLAFVIPKLSMTGVSSEDRPDFAREVNVGGTLNLLAAAKASPRAPSFVFASSLHVYGRTHHLPPPRLVTDQVQPVEHYAWHKVTCEEMVKSAGLRWAILRLGASMPIRLIVDAGVFDVPLDNRIEYVHGRDVALAMANTLRSDVAWGRTWHIGGGPACQLLYRDMAAQVLDAFGVGMLPDWAFSTTPFGTDWLDTAESQQVLRFQRHSLQDYVADVKAALGPKRQAVIALRPLIRRHLLRLSPNYVQHTAEARRLTAGATA
ncbi:MAG TPA: NAD(P)-dependent oxidoreductase [Anaerolineae bacterium]|nr:NAD(P)-dependent oxidoreductase [Anaerolineae bacterium]